VRFCTIAHGSRLPHARVLARGLAEHAGARLTVLLAATEAVATKPEPFDVVRLEEIGLEGWQKLLEHRRWADLTEFLKPHLLSLLIHEGRDAVVYLDASVDVHAPLEPVERELQRHDGVLAPRLLGSLPFDGHRPNGKDLARAGHLGASLLAVANGPVAVELVDWWKGRLRGAVGLLPADSRSGVDYPTRDLGRWIDLAPTIFPEVSLLSDPGSAVSWWNLHERRLERQDGAMTVNGRPLRFVHFEGFDPDRPFVLSVRADRVRTSSNPVLSELCESYARRLIGAGWRDNRRRRDVGRELPNGMLFDDRMSLLLGEAAEAGEDFGDVFAPKGTEAFMRWLEGPAPRGSAFGVNRYLYQVYREREDVQLAYPKLNGPDGEEFAGWAWVFGAREMGIPERFLPPRPPGIDVPPPAAEKKPEERRRVVRRRPPLPRGEKPDLSMNVIGLLTGTLGLGEAARGYVRALEAIDIPVSTTTVDVRQFVELSGSAHEGYGRVEYAELGGAERAGFDLICINPDELPRFAESVGEELFGARPSIGVWAWETDHIPERWATAFGLLDEIWVYSSYVAGNLRGAAPVPVHRVPPPVCPPDPGDAKLELGIPDGFQFLFMFDFFSTIQRKNPVGLIKAFRRAFEHGEGPQLVVKTINGVHRPEALEEVLWAARGRPDVHVIDRSLSARERDALVAGCDCYASLHRSEGFGLTLAECMALGKPVIGTDFSGTRDFMTEENSYLVPYAMTRVGAECEIYPAEGTWADPDVEAAAGLMRRVLERPEEARAKGDRARRDIEELYSPKAVGELIRSRLEEIKGLWG
jgi:glycosyltransferase involved in cell wall biosynthesis